MDENKDSTAQVGDSGRAYARLKEAIVSCELAPGSRVTEVHLASSLGLGKTPVREALLRLQGDGLARVVPRHGYQITPITLGDVQDTCQLRLLLEPASAQLAAGRIDRDLLRQLDARCRVGIGPGDHRGAAALLRANSAFHLAIARATGNRQLEAITATILARMERVFHLSLTLPAEREISHEHRELVEALLEGDGAAAHRIMTERLQASQRNVMAALLSSPQLLSVNVTSPRPRPGHAVQEWMPTAPAETII